MDLDRRRLLSIGIIPNRHQTLGATIGALASFIVLLLAASSASAATLNVVGGELLGGLDAEGGSDLAKKVAAVYLFVFRSLVEAGRERDLTKLDEAVRILRMEQETWQTFCW